MQVHIHLYRAKYYGPWGGGGGGGGLFWKKLKLRWCELVKGKYSFGGRTIDFLGVWKGNMIDLDYIYIHVNIM